MFPEIFCEEQIDFEKFKLVLGEDNLCAQNERYQLNWAGKSDAYRTLQSPTFNTLAPCIAESVDFHDTQNVFIEAENLEALKILQKSYAGKVKMIYIDPPYNTGSDSFVYPDKFAETREEYAKRVGDKDQDGYLLRDGAFAGAWRKNSKDNGHYHSNWLSMMLPRLHLAKTLLREDGVIFISIDDNEQAQLKLLCDEVFGAENFVAEMIWQQGRKSAGKNIAVNHEYCIIYAKSIFTILENVDKGQNYWKQKKIGIDELYQQEKLLRDKYGSNLLEINKEYKKFLSQLKENDIGFAHKHYNHIDEKGIYFPADASAPDKPETRCHKPLIHPITGKAAATPKLGWRYSEKTLLEMYQEGKFHFGNDETTIPCVKRYLKDTEYEIAQSVFYRDGRGASNRLTSLFKNKKLFDFPKDEFVILDFIKLVSLESKEPTLILDFFSGSGTTAHAVMQLNAEDGGNRRYICVQLPEETAENSEARKAGFANIAEIAKERIRRAGTQIRRSGIDARQNMPSENADTAADAVSGIHARPTVDTGFKVFKLAESNFKQWLSPANRSSDGLEEQLEIFRDVVEPHATTENMAYELALRLGFQLTDPMIFSDGVVWLNNASDNRKTALLLETVSDELFHKVLAQSPQKVFALDKVFDGHDALKTNAALQCKDAGVVFETL